MDKFCQITLLFLLTLVGCLISSAAGDSRMRCFNCTYVEYKKKATWGGTEACQVGGDFDEDKLSVVICDGHCVYRSVWGDVVVTQRACHRRADGPCHRIDRFNIGEGGYLSQVCCKGSRCNNAENDDAISTRYSLITLACIETIVLLWFIAT